MTIGLVIAALLCSAALPATAKERQYSLHDALHERDLERFVELLRNGHDPNEVRHGSPVLQQTAARIQDSSYAYAAALVRFGADVDARDSVGAVALHYAAMSGSAAIANLLIDAGADAQADEDGGGTILAFALMHGHFGIAELLEQRGAAVPGPERRTYEVLGRIEVALRTSRRAMDGLTDKRKARFLASKLREVRERYGFHAELDDNFIDSIVAKELADGADDRQAR